VSYVWDVEGNVRFAGWRRSPDLARQSATRPKPARSGLRTERQQWVVTTHSGSEPWVTGIIALPHTVRVAVFSKGVEKSGPAVCWGDGCPVCRWWSPAVAIKVSTSSGCPAIVSGFRYDAGTSEENAPPAGPRDREVRNRPAPQNLWR